MNDIIIINITELIGSPICISADDAQKVFSKIETFIKENKKVKISFEKVNVLISLFLDIAIGQLYGIFNDEKINSNIEIINISSEDLNMLNRVIDNAKKYYANKEKYDIVWQELEANDAK